MEGYIGKVGNAGGIKHTRGTDMGMKKVGDDSEGLKGGGVST